MNVNWVTVLKETCDRLGRVVTYTEVDVKDPSYNPSFKYLALVSSYHRGELPLYAEGKQKSSKSLAKASAAKCVLALLRPELSNAEVCSEPEAARGSCISELQVPGINLAD